MEKICVIGLGYIGLPTALMLASKGNEVIGIDCNSEIVNMLTNGKVTFEEEGLCQLFDQALENNITFTTEYVPNDVYIVAVPTPYDKLNKKIDPMFVINSIKMIMDVCHKGAIVVIESTISPGTIERFVIPIINEYGLKLGEDINIAHAPERIIPGNMLIELENNSRTIGADIKEVGERVKRIYSTFCKGNIIVTDIRTAEMTKVVENTFRDINIAFANELTKICRQDNMDVYEIIKIANMHPRVNILQPGPGVGGHCISVDPWFLVGDYPGLTSLIRHARLINDSMPEFVLNRIYEIMKKEGLKNLSKIGLYGLTYKEDVDDIRESPTLQLLECAKKHLCSSLKVFDPMVKDNIVENQYQDFDLFIEDIDLLVIMVAHTHIKSLDYCLLNNKILFDTKNILTFDSVHKL